MLQVGWFLFGRNENSSVFVCFAGSRGADENNEDYLSKEVRSNNFLNLASTRKRVPKVTIPVGVVIELLIYLQKRIHMVIIETLNSAFPLCAFPNRMKRSQKAWILFIRESGNFTWRRFVVETLMTYLLTVKKMYFKKHVMSFCLWSGYQPLK